MWSESMGGGGGVGFDEDPTKSGEAEEGVAAWPEEAQGLGQLHKNPIYRKHSNPTCSWVGKAF